MVKRRRSLKASLAQKHHLFSPAFVMTVPFGYERTISMRDLLAVTHPPNSSTVLLHTTPTAATLKRAAYTMAGRDHRALWERQSIEWLLYLGCGELHTLYCLDSFLSKFLQGLAQERGCFWLAPDSTQCHYIQLWCSIMKVHYVTRRAGYPGTTFTWAAV